MIPLTNAIGAPHNFSIIEESPSSTMQALVLADVIGDFEVSHIRGQLAGTSVIGLQ